MTMLPTFVRVEMEERFASAENGTELAEVKEEAAGELSEMVEVCGIHII